MSMLFLLSQVDFLPPCFSKYQPHTQNQNMHFFLCNRVPLTMFHTIFFLFYYIPFFALSPIRFCYMFYNFEVIILFLNASHLCNDLLPPPSGVPAPASHAHPTSAFFSFPYFRGASLDFGAATHLGATCFPPLSGVSSHASHRHLTSAFFSFPYFRGASLDFGAATHLGATCFPPLSGVHRHAFTNHLTSVTTCFPLLPGCQTMPRMRISPRKHLLPPPSGVLPSAIRILGIFPCGTISTEQRMHRIS